MGVPTAGSITVPLVFEHGAFIARARAAEAGWTSTISDPHAEQVLVTFSRYLGPDPDEQVQTQHVASLKDTLTAEGFGVGEPEVIVARDSQPNPLLATAQLVATSSPDAREQAIDAAWRRKLWGTEGVRFAGTCFAFRHMNAFLTAAHCIGGVDPETLLIVTPEFPPRGHRVARVECHPTADLAVVHLDADAWPPVEPFTAVAAAPPLGAEFMAYGFPEDAPPPDQEQHEPRQRLFRGYVQRRLHYELAPFAFNAVEMSIPSPDGLSGGPLFAPHDFNQVIGVATKNVESTSHVRRRETVVEGEKTFSLEQEHFVQYGIAALLEPHLGWLDGIVPFGVRIPEDAS
jgi:hypothetical protein